MALDLGELSVILEADTSKFQKKMSGIGDTMSKIGASVAKAGLAMGAALGTVAVASGKMAVDFERDMSNIGTLLGAEGSDRVKELGKDIKAMAQATGKPLDDLAGGMYQVVSAFGDTADSAKILEISAKASAAGLATTEDAVNLLSATTKGYGDTSAAAVAKVSDLAFQTVKLGQTTFPELAASMGKAVPLAATLGVGMESLFGSMATLTGVTGNTAEVSTQLRATLQALINPTESMAAKFEELGITSGAAAIEAHGFQGTLDLLKEATGGNTQQLAKMFGSVESLNAVLALTGEQSDNFTAKTKAMTEAQGASDEAFKIQQATVGAAMDRIKQAVAVVGVELGERFLPVVAQMAEWVAAHLPQIQAFFETAFDAIAESIDFVARTINWLIGNVWQPLLEGWQTGNTEMQTGIQSTAAFIGDAMFKVWEVIQRFSDIWHGFVEGWETGNTEMQTSFGSAGAVIADVAFKVWEVIQQFADVWRGFVEGWETGNTDMQTSWATAGAIIADVVYQMWVVIQKFAEAVQVAIKTLVAVALFLWEAWGDEIMAIWRTTFDTVTAVLSNALGILGGFLDVFIGLFTGDWKRMGDGITAIWSNLWDGVGNIVIGAVEVIQQVVHGLLDSIGNAIDAVKQFLGFKSSADEAQAAMSSLSNRGEGPSFPGFAEGGIVPGPKGAPMLAVVHGGERVLTPAQQQLDQMLAGFDTPHMAGFVGRVGQVTGGGRAGAMSEAGQAAMTAVGGGGISLVAYIGDRQLEDIIVEVNDKAKRRGRT